ncbi:hypothetical protein CCMSSC00406_0009468 [Pleurotus cornucopiae]|uniref:Uncharacterized protein n=1 Tax=Pleurotus cornucopiae TaxID=5321 RepID=A0ACB7J2U7_PLECO|nr:hypothetical protein CCMSSC00406_0009468 [Pleurotus cornucopiae]
MSYFDHDSHLELPQRRTRSKQLPIELIERIISLLEEYTDDERGGRTLTRVAADALRACSLVCRTWSNICQPRICSSFTANLCLTADLTFLHFTAPHLYKHIHITHLTITPPARCAGHPPMGPRHLAALCLDNWSSACAFLSLPPLESGVTAVLANVPHLRRILSLCSSTLLENCHISDRGSAPTPIDSTVPQGVRMEALRKLGLSHAESRLLGMPHIELPNLESLFCEYTRNHKRIRARRKWYIHLHLISSWVLIVQSFQPQRTLPLLASAQQFGSAP